MSYSCITSDNITIPLDQDIVNYVPPIKTHFEHNTSPYNLQYHSQLCSNLIACIKYNDTNDMQFYKTVFSNMETDVFLDFILMCNSLQLTNLLKLCKQYFITLLK